MILTPKDFDQRLAEKIDGAYYRKKDLEDIRRAVEVLTLQSEVVRKAFATWIDGQMAKSQLELTDLEGMRSSRRMGKQVAGAKWEIGS